MGVLDNLVDELAARIEERRKHTTPTGTPSTPYYAGPGGLFGVHGLERDVISTRVQPRGLAGSLPARGTMMMNPRFAYLTGIQNVTGSNPTNVCDDGQIAGPGKSCIQTADFGRYTFMTREFEINRVGQQIDRGEFQDLYLINDPLLNAALGPMVTPNVPGNMNLVREALMRFLEVGVAFQNKLIPQVWTGNPANNSAGNGYMEFPGLDILIGTDKVDAITGTNCPSLDSLIRDFNYSNVTLNGGDEVVNWLTYMVRYVRTTAERTGLAPVQWTFVMRETLFYELTAVWPCAYMTRGCSFRTSDGTIVQNVDAGDQIAMRDAMRNGRYLVVDGIQYPVIFDDGIVEEDSGDNANINATCFASDIYFIPLSVTGGLAVTYWEYFDYARGPMQAVQDGQLTDDFWTDGGRFLWHKKPPLNWCVQWIAKTEPRIIFRTPHLAFRLQNVMYCPLIHEREPFPTDNYFVNGGVTGARATDTLYSDWNLPA